MKNSRRFQFIDVVAGIMICWMILGHCNYFSPGHKLEFHKYISFFMPYFYYKSGWFFKPTSQKALIKKDTNKLICYYVIFSVLGVIVWSILRIPEGNSLSSSFKIAFAQFIRNGSFSGNGALWFLLSLFLVRQIANNVLKYKFSSFYTPLICFGFAYGLFKLGWHEHSWWLGNVFSGLCFFSLGFGLKGIDDNRYVVFVSGIIYVIFLLCDYYNIIGFPYLYMHANKMYNGNYILFYPMAIAGIIMTNGIFKSICSKRNFNILEYVGQNSMNFYVTHWILFTIICFILNVYAIETPDVRFYILLIASIVLLPIISILLNRIKNNIYDKFRKTKQHFL